MDQDNTIMANPWDEIFLDNFDVAYKIANENYLKTASDFDLRARAKCSLLLCNYKNALEDFLALNEIENNADRLYDETYMDIGLCYYAMGDNDKAIDYFKFAASNKTIMGTSDISVPVSILYYIAIKLERQDILKIAEKELKRRKPEVPQFLLGKLSETDLNDLFERYPNGPYRNREQCKIEFYKAVSQLRQGRIEKYLEHLGRCVDLKGLYLEFVYYIAKVEYDRYSNIQF
jgi:tetratricopeptide (TPR) repeat protein